MQAFVAAFDGWWPAPEVRRFPFAEAAAAFREQGKHFVPDEVTDRLRRVRDGWERVSGATVSVRLLESFLDAALDKTDGRYDYGTYCALGLLDLPAPEPAWLDRQTLLARRDLGLLALLGDLIGFEMDALEGSAAILPQMRPAPDLSRRRLRLALAALRPSLERAGIQPRGEDVEADVRFVLARIGPRVSARRRLRLDLSLLPVHVVHDEYLFLRVLQSFELTFAWLAVTLREAVEAMPAAPERTTERLRLANLLLREAARLFPLIGSMQPAAFHDFRRFTEGASAIQSAGYKTVEALCRRPDAERLASSAFASVPQVQAQVEAGLPTLEEALEAAAADPAFDPRRRAEIEAQLAEFARQMLRWRQAHFELAKRFLGERGGTGYTEGVPYLDRVRAVPVFREAGHGEA